MSTLTVYIIAGVAYGASFLVKRWLNHTYRTWSKVPNQHNLTGAETAAHILAANNITNVRIEAVRGRLTDHFDPQRDILRLSETNYGMRSVAAMAVSAHEAGHAIQDATEDIRLKMRKYLVPVAALGARFGPMAVLAGIFLSSGLILRIGAFMLLGTLLFQLFTLPVEFNASRRALRNLEALGVTDEDDREGAKKVLTAAAFTYVAAAATSFAYFATLLATSRGRRV